MRPDRLLHVTRLWLTLLGATALSLNASHSTGAHHTTRHLPPAFSMAVGTCEAPFPTPEQPFTLLRHFDWSDVTDCPAEFIADPFLFHDNNQWFLFFEILNAETRQGDIGLATSPNGTEWTYHGIVLNEPFHLSYPYVFKHNDTIYMIPESAHAGGIFLYEAAHFPDTWKQRVKLLDQPLRDPMVLHHNNLWWLFASDPQNRNLYLYLSPELESGWRLHPSSPVVRNNAHTARCAGHISHASNTLYRVAQDCSPTYGNAVRIFQIDTLTPEAYHETELPISPVLKGGDFPWATEGMHQLSALPLPQTPNRWLLAIDGYNKQTPGVTLNVEFKGKRLLEGISLRPKRLRRGTSFQLRLFWDTTLAADDDRQQMAVFVHFKHKNKTIFQADHALPHDAEVSDVIASVPQNAPLGDYQIELGLYDLNTGHRIRVARHLKNRIPLPQAIMVTD